MPLLAGPEVVGQAIEEVRPVGLLLLRVAARRVDPARGGLCPLPGLRQRAGRRAEDQGIVIHTTRVLNTDFIGFGEKKS